MFMAEREELKMKENCVSTRRLATVIYETRSHETLDQWHVCLDACGTYENSLSATSLARDRRWCFPRPFEGVYARRKQLPLVIGLFENNLGGRMESDLVLDELQDFCVGKIGD
jgi:hypothetical protein